MLFSARPVFIGWIALVVQLPLQLFFILWAALFFGGMSSAALGAAFGAKSNVSFVLFGAAAFFGVPLVAYFGKMLNYARTEYRFYPDRLEFDEGFFSVNRKVIKFEDVKEVTLRKGILQRIYNLGTVYLGTATTGSAARNNIFGALGFGNVSGSGIGVRDVTGPDALFDKIRALVDKSNA